MLTPSRPSRSTIRNAASTTTAREILPPSAARVACDRPRTARRRGCTDRPGRVMASPIDQRVQPAQIVIRRLGFSLDAYVYTVYLSSMRILPYFAPYCLGATCAETYINLDLA